MTRPDHSKATSDGTPGSPADAPTVAVLCGGVGAAKFLRGLIRVVPQQNVTAIVNTADDTILHGLHVSPDIDTCIYTMAEAINTETGWGLADETWQAMETLKLYGGITWFGLGDRDLGTHLYRTQRLADGAGLAAVTAEIAAAWGLGTNVLPVTEQRIETRVTVVDEGEIGFQEYFVRRRHDVAVTEIRFAGAEATVPAPGTLAAIANADVVVIAPSNPIVSIGPLLAVPGIREALIARRSSSIAISPIVGGAALKGPADRMLRELGHEPSVGGVAKLYAEIASTLVIDEVDDSRSSTVTDAGIDCLVTSTIMVDADRAAALAETVLAAVVNPREGPSN